MGFIITRFSAAPCTIRLQTLKRMEYIFTLSLESDYQNTMSNSSIMPQSE